MPKASGALQVFKNNGENSVEYASMLEPVGHDLYRVKGFGKNYSTIQSGY
ncbi:MAG: hypothetical protein IPJ29_10470 [Chitinophagaceae bacterium]|nr:hypothetical protein [Chitinophagaceae bacterium]